MNQEKNNHFIQTIFEVYAGVAFQELADELDFMNSRFLLADKSAFEKLPKAQQIDNLFNLIEDGASDLAIIFLESLASKNLLEILISEEFNQIILELKERCESKGEAQFFSAVELSDEFREELRRKIDQKFGDVMRIVFKVNPDLITGFVINYKDEVYDYSLKKLSNEIIVNLVKSKLSIVKNE